MAAIAQTTFKSVKTPVTLTVTTLTSADTITYSSGAGQILVLYNKTASPVDVTIDGAGSTTIAPSGYGGTISVASGKVITVAANGATAVNLDNISAFLGGAVAVTGGTGVVAMLLG